MMRTKLDKEQVVMRKFYLTKIYSVVWIVQRETGEFCSCRNPFPLPSEEKSLKYGWSIDLNVNFAIFIGKIVKNHFHFKKIILF